MQVFKLYGKEISKELKLHQLYVGGLENTKIKLGNINIRTNPGNLGLSEEQDIIHFSKEGL